MHDELYHHGVKGMKWGVRRFRNADGSLTDAGKKRQQKQTFKEIKKYDKKGVDRDRITRSKNEELTAAVNRGKKIVNQYLAKENEATEIVRKTRDKEYEKLLRDYKLKNSGKNPGYDDDYELKELAKSNAHFDKNVQRTYGELNQLRKQYENEIHKSVDSLLGEYGKTVIRDQSHRNTAADAFDDAVWSAGVADIRNKTLKELGL